jgi:phosphate transport system protein
MPSQGFNQRLDTLKGELVAQGERVQRLMEAAFSSTFSRDAAVSSKIQAMDDEVDRVDVELEKASVSLLTDATKEGSALEPSQLRAVLTIVKINNELERIADGGVNIAEQAAALAKLGGRKGAGAGGDIPETFQVMANSVVGILRDVNRAYQRSDGALAKVVLQSEDAVEAFKAAILQDAERQIAGGAMPVDFAFALHEIANECCRMADHCTNIAEQVIYSLSGAIVRHTDAGWVEVKQ